MSLSLKDKKHSLLLLLLWQLPFKGWRQSQIFANQNSQSLILSILSTFTISSSVACLSCVILDFSVLRRSFKVVTGGVAVRVIINQVSNSTHGIAHSRQEVRLRWKWVFNIINQNMGNIFNLIFFEVRSVVEFLYTCKIICALCRIVVLCKAKVCFPTIAISVVWTIKPINPAVVCLVITYLIFIFRAAMSMICPYNRGAINGWKNIEKQLKVPEK